MNGKQFNKKDLIENIKSRLSKHKRLLWSMWHEIASELRGRSSDSVSSEALTKLFISAMHNLYDLCCFFVELDECGVSSKLKNALDRDIKSYSSLTMSRIVDYSIAAQWLTHLVRRDLYILCLISKLSEPRQAEAIGVSGPWSRLDLPMRERVFTWSEIAEEVAGRGWDKRKQRRYRMGLEQYKDPWPNEGFYWREIRNEPFSFGDESSNPYPHRNVLWRS